MISFVNLIIIVYLGPLGAFVLGGGALGLWKGNVIGTNASENVDLLLLHFSQEAETLLINDISKSAKIKEVKTKLNKGTDALAVNLKMPEKFVFIKIMLASVSKKMASRRLIIYSKSFNGLSHQPASSLYSWTNFEKPPVFHHLNTVDDLRSVADQIEKETKNLESVLKHIRYGIPPIFYFNFII